MVEVTPLDPSSFLSNSDKHRGTRFPQTIDDDVCLETGIDLGDGTHILFKPGMRHSSYTYSISQRYPDEWFGARFALYPLLSKLYVISPTLRKSSPRRNGICVYLNSRAVLLFKCRAPWFVKRRTLSSGIEEKYSSGIQVHADAVPSRRGFTEQYFSSSAER